MVTGKNISPLEYASLILKKMKLGKQHMEIANAIYLGDKCSDLSVEEIKKHTDDMVGKSMIYFGNTDFEAPTGRHYHQYKTLCGVTHKEFMNEYPRLTIQEIVIAVHKGLRKGWGNYDTWNVSLKLFNELIVDYQNSDIRRNIVATYNHYADECRPQVVTISQLEQERICMEHQFNQFEKFKEKGIQGVIITHRDYDYLLTKCSLPDFKEFLIEAGKVVSKPLKNQTTVSEVINKTMSSKIIYEAKRMAIIKLYAKLIEEGVSIKQFIQSSAKE